MTYCRLFDKLRTGMRANGEKGILIVTISLKGGLETCPTLKRARSAWSGCSKLPKQRGARYRGFTLILRQSFDKLRTGLRTGPGPPVKREGD
jgi:hypothetical protein